MALLTSWFLYDILILIGLAVTALYAYFKHKYQHWRKRGIAIPEEPSFPYGNFPGVNRKRGVDMLCHDLYLRYPKERLIGCYLISRPILLVTDVELVKTFLVKDFDHFRDRGFGVNLEKDPLGEHLFLMSGQEWRNLRIKLTPTFTSGKMKMMFPTLLDVGLELQKVFEKSSAAGEVEIKDILARYTTDVISSVAFGLESNSLQNPDVSFRKIGHELANPDLRQTILNVLVFAAPSLAKVLPIKFIPQHIEDFFINLMRETMDYRREKKVHRNDFLQLLMQLTDLGYVKDADNPENDKLSAPTQYKKKRKPSAATCENHCIASLHIQQRGGILQCSAT